jgi:hypothetical protein
MKKTDDLAVSNIDKKKYLNCCRTLTFYMGFLFYIVDKSYN